MSDRKRKTTKMEDMKKSQDEMANAFIRMAMEVNSMRTQIASISSLLLGYLEQNGIDKEEAIKIADEYLERLREEHEEEAAQPEDEEE